MNSNFDSPADTRLGTLGAVAGLAIAGIAVTVGGYFATGLPLSLYTRWPSDTIASLTFLWVLVATIAVWLLARRRYEQKEAVIVALGVGLLSALVNYALAGFFLMRA